jgi:hypothetical protein
MTDVSYSTIAQTFKVLRAMPPDISEAGRLVLVVMSLHAPHGVYRSGWRLIAEEALGARPYTRVAEHVIATTLRELRRADLIERIPGPVRGAYRLNV